MSNDMSDIIVRIQGTEGHVEVEGPAPSHPLSFTVYSRKRGEPPQSPGKKYDYPRIGRGFIYEADNTAVDVAPGRKESATMPWRETIRVMEIMDDIGRQGGTKNPQDQE